ncbi:hypothetical protein [Candidatus Cyanaurora vandensis]|uniref:hypothetical protein n=1 Tax=Candidatus Cyanaurora vandensis TaxID=2714958 RepID=UPI0025799968|nr:hypothetical protein [Candidatus Cyanaurora vandensis]
MDLEQSFNEWVARVEQDLITWEAWANPLFQQVDTVLEQWVQQTDHWFFEVAGTMEGELNRPVACQGCGFYHGRQYGEAILTCALHPTGPELSHCRDWQA